MGGALDEWFVAEVLPLEGRLVRYLLHARQRPGDIDDLRQEVFARVYEAAAARRPEPAWPFVYTVARNLIIDRLRHSQVVPIDLLADPGLDREGEEIPADRALAAKQELSRVMAAFEALPDRCREVVRLRKIEGISQREVAARLGIAEHTVEKQVAKGVRRLARMLFSGIEAEREEADRKEARRGRAS